MAELTAGTITHALVRERFARSTVMQNYAPAGWWENDVCEVTAAGFWREYEVKVSRADFRADAEKRRWSRDARGNVKKYDLLAAGSVKGPSRFTYVVPDGLIGPDDLPPFAGLIVARVAGRAGFVHLTVARPAPKIHGEKVGPEFTAAIREAAYWRFHRDRSDLARLPVDATADRVLDLLAGPLAG